MIVPSLIGVYYYQRGVYTLYMRPEVREPGGLARDALGRLAATIAAAAILVVGTLPGPILDWARRIAGGSY